MPAFGALGPRILLLVAFLAVALPTTALAETRPHYDLQVSLSFGSATLEVVQKTTLRNNTGVDLPDLVFHAVPAFFDAFSLQSARLDGREIPATMNGTVLELRPEAPLAAGATAEVELRYQVKVPAQGGRFGRGEGILALGNWFPVLAVYQEGWDRHQYVDVGDAFYTEVADFDVTVASDVPVKIAASGALVRQEGNRQSFRAEGVRDFAMAVSDRYQLRTREVDGVRLLAYGPSVPRLEVYLAEAARTLRWFSEKLVPYPYPTLSIAEIHAPDNVPTAQEYPALIFVYKALGADGGGTGSYSEYTVGHEVAHQWFYSLVGDDQVHDPWLDEALTTYVDLLFYRDQSPRHFDYYFGRAVAGYRARVAAGHDRPVNSTIYDFPDDLPYFDIVYRKGAVFLDKLREAMGDEPFFDLLRDYLRSYSGKVATPRAFLDMAYTRVGPGLPPLVARYFTYGAFADGAGYQLEVSWPDQLAVSANAEVTYQAGFPVAEAKVWLDNRLIYRGAGDGPVRFALDGVEEGEYAMRLDLLDAQGALYQRAQRVKVAPRAVLTPAAPPLGQDEPAASLPQEGEPVTPLPQEGEPVAPILQEVQPAAPLPQEGESVASLPQEGEPVASLPREEGGALLSQLWDRVKQFSLSLWERVGWDRSAISPLRSGSWSRS